MGNKYSTDWSEKKLQQALYLYYSKNNKYCCRNKYVFTGPRHYKWESDFFMQSKSKLSTEFECKISRSDWAKEQKDKVVKHKFLQEVFETNGDVLLNPKYNPDRKNSKEFSYFCPNYFYVTCQQGLIQPGEVEAIFPYAGLKWVMDDFTVKTKLRKKLHPLKQNLDSILLQKFYWRTNTLEWELYKFVQDIKNKPEKYKSTIPITEINKLIKKIKL